ncbi:MAG: hypothetical protein M1828_001666 [Chrysothrix sp. TS-e1954]|nr:MAG: hypothetical protein M1828_001666 [Chrysothrix sp. TS-e1954]
MNSSGPEVVRSDNEGLQAVGDEPMSYANDAKHATYQPILRGQQQQQPRYDSEPKYLAQPRRRNPFGLSALAFGALVSLATAIVVGGLVGGVVGGVLGSKDDGASCSPTATVTATSDPSTSTSTSSTALATNYAPIFPQSVSTVALPCPEKDNTEQPVFVGADSYKYQCRYNYSHGDITNVIAYSMADCTQACSSFNAFNGSRYCLGVTFNARLGFELSTAQEGGNCWLKSTLNQPSINQTAPQMSAILQD